MKDDFGYEAKVAGEIEFYLSDVAPYPSHPFWLGLQAECEGQLLLHHCEPERGAQQYEIALMPEPPQEAADALEQLICIVGKQAGRCGITAEFAAKPFADQPGNGLHIHVHLEDEAGQRVFYKSDETISPALRYSMGGLLARLSEDMIIFCPTPESRLRLFSDFHAPCTASWGANNRTCALRLPDKPHGEKHIEHRVAGADADPHAVIGAILRGIHQGLSERLDPGAQQYGNANDAHYGLPRLI